MSQPRPALIARQLAARFVAGDWTERALVACIAAQCSACGAKVSAKLQRRIAADVLAHCSEPPPPSPQRMSAMLLRSESFKQFVRRLRRHGAEVLRAPMFLPAPAFAGCGAPELSTPAYLADWLETTPAQLDWLADDKRQHGRTAIPLLQHYHYAWVAKRSGSLRLLEAPKQKLKAMQRRILAEILDRAPVSAHAFGFVRGRSCIDAASRHAGEDVVITLDLRHFFSSIGAERVHGLFRLIGYPWANARLLTGLCTTATPVSVLDRAPEPARQDHALRQMLATPHLAQGAPTSPALANIICWRLDQRLAGLATSASARYSRYADDLAFSGAAAFGARRTAFIRAVDRIAREEGFQINARKTRFMPASQRQRVTGIIVNQHLNAARDDYDRLKAVLYNCLRHGAAGQNRDGAADFRAHLDGRIGWIAQLNPRRAEKLRVLSDAIAW
jgi:RNA-directed DNA polymerase